MQLRHRPFLAACAAAALAALLPSPAHGTTPLVTDPAGDAGVLGISEDAIDILEGDIAQSGTDLLFRVTLVDIDAMPRLWDTTRHLRFQSMYQGLRLTVGVGSVGHTDTTATGDVQVSGGTVATGGPNPTVSVTLDPATNVIEWTVPLTVANAALSATCPTCTPIGSGSTLGGFQVVALYEHNVANVVRSTATVRQDEASAPAATFTVS